MSRKPSVLLTLLEPNEALARQLGSGISRLGADCSAHFWNDRPDAQVLAQLFKEVVRPDLNAWVICGSPQSFTPSALSALSLTALASQHLSLEEDRPELPIIISPSQGTLPPLPTPLANASIVTHGLEAKTIALCHTAKKAAPRPYRLNVLPLHGLGVWLECGPKDEPWQGVLCGVSGAEPDAHGVGQAGIIPQRSTLHYPVKGMKLQVRSHEFTAWGTQNTLSTADSYFIRLSALPEAVVLGPFPSEDEPELYVLDLC